MTYILNYNESKTSEADKAMNSLVLNALYWLKLLYSKIEIPNRCM